MHGAAPQVTVVMACHNGSATLGAAVASVQAQTVADWELLVVDDVSTDDSLAVARALAAGDRRIRVLTGRTNSGGPAGPRNQGLREARGAVLCLLDQDDTWLPGKLEAQLRTLAEGDYGLVCADAYVERPGLPRALYSELWGPMAEGDATLALLERCFVPALTAAVPMAVLREVGGFEESLAGVDDYDLWLRIVLAGHRVGVVREPLATWRVGPASLSHRHVQQLERLSACLRGQRLTEPAERTVVARRLREIDDELRAAHLHELATHGRPRDALRALRLSRGPRDVRRVAGVLRGRLGPSVAGPGTEVQDEALTVAVVIPCYNYGRFLAGAIESALSQTLPPSEVVVVDDGSTDDTAQVAARFAPAVRCLTIPNGGASRARNTGLDAVTSSHVVFLDADDRLAPTFLERCRDALVGQPRSCLAYTQSRGFEEHTTVTAIGEWSLPALLRANYLNPSSLMPTGAVRTVRYDESLRSGLEDWELYLGLAATGVTGVLVDEPLLLYRHHDAGITAQARRRPVRLARTKLRILVKHRRLYGLRGGVRQALLVTSQLATDLGERVNQSVRRRIREARRR